jgi:hypothetical protein
VETECASFCTAHTAVDLQQDGRMQEQGTGVSCLAVLVLRQIDESVAAPVTLPWLWQPLGAQAARCARLARVVGVQAEGT